MGQRKRERERQMGGGGRKRMFKHVKDTCKYIHSATKNKIVFYLFDSNLPFSKIESYVGITLMTII